MFSGNQLTGVFSLETTRLFNYIYQGIDKNYSIAYSPDGYDKISLITDFKLISNNDEELLLLSEQAGFLQITPMDIPGEVQ